MLPADSPFASLPAPGPHPATAELRAYAAGTLPPADEHRLEAHTLDCERCAELLAGFAMSDAATTDHALAGLRTRLQARVADDLTAPVLLPAARPLWLRLAAAMALLGAIGAGLWGWEQQRPAAETAKAPRQTAAPAVGPPLAGPATVAPTPLPQTTATVAPRSAAVRLNATPSRPADYASGRPRRRATRPGPVRRPRAGAVQAPTARNAEAATETGLMAIQAATTTSSAPDSASRVPAATAPSATVVAASRLATPSKEMTDSAAHAAGFATTYRLNTAKGFESAALVRDKPMAVGIAIAPAPVAGTPALRSYLQREAARFEPEQGERALNGVVRLRFTVEADGKLNNIQVVRGMRADYDTEALRLICEGPAWQPGIAGGRRAALPVEIAVSF